MRAIDIISILESFAPPVYQESYDNSGLQVGDPAAEVTGVLLTLDITEVVVEEAARRGCNMIVAHHPIIFSGLKRLAGRSHVERVVMLALKKDILIYATHTNLDNARAGVNAMIAEKLGLEKTSILQMMTTTLRKLYTFAPLDAADRVREALFAAGAGDIGKYRECSFNTQGAGTFKPDADADPAIGEAGGPREQVAEVKIEVLVQQHKEARILKALFDAHPYEEVAFEFIHLHNANQELGAGLVGTLPAPMDGRDFLQMLKRQMNTECIRHTALLQKPIQKVALCGGAGSFLLKEAMAAGADVFITGDYKYHQFFDADGRILIADIGHGESEQFTPQLLQRILGEKLRNFALLLSETKTNPVNYFF
jgi:dinuclear metal center YbgI/SA1388 family protein